MKSVEDFVKTLEGRPLAVFGLARSGLSVAKAFRSAGANMIAWDDADAGKIKAKALGVQVEKLTEKNLKACAFLVLAPGVPLHFPEPHAVVKAARKAGIEIICDIELYHRIYPGLKTVGITGTNGKSTTTALIHHILKSANMDAVMGGNIGLPVFDLPPPAKKTVAVLELSSYQIDLCPTFRPDIGLLMNITPDHIDRHGTLENYAASKEHMLEGKGTAIIGTDDDLSRMICSRVKSRGERKVITFTTENDALREVMKGAVLKGMHNYQNALAAWHVCKEMGVKDDDIFKAIQSFPGLPHRQFPVRVINGVSYINDSKATNAEAASKALSSYDNIYWIAGGRPKEGGLNGLESLMPRVKKSYLIGEAAGDFSVWMEKNSAPFQKCGTLEKAVRAAHADAQAGGDHGVVLLSPACASFDQFSSYEERGDMFAKIVKDLKESVAA